MNRRGNFHWLALICSLFLAGSTRAEEIIKPELARTDPKTGILWYDAKHLDIEGKGWQDTRSYYDRLPAKAEGKVRDAVWNLSRHSAGILVRFTTDATTIHARWTLTGKNLAMPHMPATGVSGLDLYAQDKAGTWRWLSVGRPTEFPTNTVVVASGLPAGKRNYLLYLPLYNGVTSVEIGLAQKDTLAKPDPRPAAQRKPLVFYGTSITQGGCASRPGMVHTAIIGRKLNRPVINLGFSGNGKMEKEVVDLMAELDPAVYIIDCLPNMSAKEVTDRTGPLVKALRQARPKTPILLVEDRSYANSVLLPAQKQRNDTSRAALKKEFNQLKETGVASLFYLPGDRLLGDDGEDTVDGSHPTDLGFMRHAEAFCDALGPVLATKGN